MAELVQTGPRDVPSPAATRSLDLPPDGDQTHILLCENQIDTAAVHMHQHTHTHTLYEQKHEYRGFDVGRCVSSLAFSDVENVDEEKKRGEEFTRENLICRTECSITETVGKRRTAHMQNE